MVSEEELEREIARKLEQKLGDTDKVVDEEIKTLKAQRKAAEAEEDAAEAEEDAAEAEEDAAEAEEKEAKDKDKKSKKDAGHDGIFRRPLPGSGILSAALNKPITSFSGSGGGKSGRIGVKIFIILLIILHVADLRLDFTRDGQFLTVWALVYAIVALFLAPALLYRDGFVRAFTSRTVFVYIGVSLGTWALPMVLDLIPQSITRAQLGPVTVFNFFILFTPIWVMYVLFTEAENDIFVERMQKAWLVIWIILLIGVLFTAINDMENTAGLGGSYHINPGETIREVWDMSYGGIKDAIETIIGIGPSVSTFLERNLNDTLGNQYQGQVDPYSSNRLGVQIKKLTPISSTFYEGNDVVVYADIEGESFRDKVIALTLRCYALDNEENLYNGSIEAEGGRIPEEILFTHYQPSRARCTIPNLPEGYYDVVVAGRFNYETWSYIQYYFAPHDIIEDIYANGDNPADEADIDEYPIAIYNNGPAELGLASQQPQPIAINPERPRMLPTFGASLTSSWLSGEIDAVRDIRLLVPEPFTLISCDRADKFGHKQNPQYEIDPETGYRIYTFDKIHSPGALFESVTCFLSFEGASEEDKTETARQFMESYDLVLKTFGAQSEYMFTLEQDTRVHVENRGGLR